MTHSVLSVDCGTQSLRAIIFDEKGNILAKEKEAIGNYKSLRPGWHEAPAEMFCDILKRVLKKLREGEPEVFASIEAMSITTQRDTGICLDSDYVPLRDAIIWMDERETTELAPMKFPYGMAFSLVGMNEVIFNLRKRAQAHWIIANEPEIWSKTKKFVFLSTYLNYRLTGRLADSDASAVGHIPFNYKTRQWDGALGTKTQIFNIPKDKLFEVVPSCTEIGKLSEQASEEFGLPRGLSLIASGSDKACETVGAGCAEPDTAAVSLGSQTTIETTTESYYELDPFFPPFCSVKQGSFNPEITIYRGFWMVSWFENEFAHVESVEAEKLGLSALELLDERLGSIPPGCDGLILQPYWGVNLTKPHAKGGVLGFSDSHTRLHLYRAIIEGIGYAVLEGVEKLEKVSKVKLKKIALSGGGSQSDAICQIAADILGRTVYRVQTYETSALGAATCAMYALGVYESFDEAVMHMVHPCDYFEPDLGKASLYKSIYEKVYKQIYPHLKPVYRALYEITSQEKYNEKK